MTIVKLTRNEYEALLNWARDGAIEADAFVTYQALKASIDQSNGLRRYTLTIAWNVLPEARAPSLTALGTMKRTIDLARPPTKADVLTALTDEHYHESSVLVTADSNGEVGWYDLEHFPWA